MARLVGRTRTEALRTQLPILVSIVAVLAFTPLATAQSSAPVVSPMPTPGCAKTDFQCQDGSCIPRESLCNNVSDCANGEDEGVHLCGCLKTEFRCEDGTCLPDEMHCDGKLDCPGGRGEDEIACTTLKTTCSASKFFCGPLDGDCIELLKVCDGYVDCFVSGTDEANCPPIPGSPCSGNQFECSGEDDIASHVQGSDCIPLRQQCDTVFQCANGVDESSCTFPELIQPPQSQAVMSGDVVNLTCIAEGTPTPTISWLKNLMPLPSDSRYQVTSVGGVGTLIISEATVLDVGEYSCEVSIPSYSFVSVDKAAVNVTDDDPDSCLSSDGSIYLEGDRFFTVVDNVSGDASSAAADIVFVVDQSGSMLEAQQWIGEMAPLLDETLKGNGVGVGNVPNQFALVGFGGMNAVTMGGVVLTQLTSVNNFVAATPGLTIDGSVEDGYSGIQVALDEVELRNSSEIVRVMVLATNGERDTIPGNENLTRDVIEEELRGAGFVLNVVVGQGFPIDMELSAFGMDFNGTCYAYDFVNDIVIHPSCERNDGIGSTYEDYVQLAYNLQGSAWDIQAIERLDDGLDGFSRSFVAAKVDEVMGLLRRCFACTCKQDPLDCEPVPDVALEDCKGRAPPKAELAVTVSPDPASDIPVGSDVELTCDIFISPEASEDEITIQWEQFGAGALCTPPDCMRTITLTDIDVSSEGLYICRVTAGDQEGMGSTFLTTVVPPVIVTPPGDTTSREGKPVQVTCVAEGKPEPLVYWVRSDGGSLSDSALVEATTESSSKLVIDPAALEDSGQYECVAISKAGTARASFDIQVNIANCVVTETLTLLPKESQIVLVYEPAVDLVLLVDESGSMLTEHKWLVQMVKELDESLQKVGVGVDEPNLIAVVGFGSQYQDYESGRVVSQFVPSDEIGPVIDDLWVDGKREDGYVAIQFALDNLQFRDGTARQFILVTDEDRYAIDPSLSYDYIKKLLEDNDARLNAIVSEKFAGDRSVPAMGVDSSSNAYVYYPLASYYSEMPANLSVRVVSGGHSVANSGHGDTHDDYTSLVLELGGAAWDLGLLALGPPVTDAFTSAFVGVEAREILGQVSKCQNCTCGDAGLQCVSLYPFIDIYPECSIPDFPEDDILSLDQTLDVVIDPRFHKFPNYGNLNTSMECRVVGDDDATTYKWTFNSRQLQSNMDVSSVDGNSLLTLVDPNATSTGWYTCFTDKLDSSTGFETAYVEVYEPVVILEPLRSEATVGDNVTITARLKEDGTFAWSFWDGTDPYTESNTLPENAVANDLSSRESVLTITHVEKSNTGLYICRGAGPNQQGTSRAEVLVSEPELKISVHPEVAAVCAGSRVVLTCQVDCPCPGVTMKWTLAQGVALPPGPELWVGNDSRSLLLVFDEVTPELPTQYQCSAVFGTQRRSLFAYVEVIDSPASSVGALPTPVLSLDPFGGSYVAPINSSVEVDCTSEVPNPVITWHPADGSEELPEGVVVSMTSSDTSVFSISSVNEEHYKKYLCSVSTVYEECGPEPVDTAFQIFKPGSPLRAPTVDPHPASGPIEVDLGASVTVRCTSNVPYAIFTWQRLHAPYELPEGIETYEEGLQTSILSIDVMNESMYAQYLCKVRTPPSLSEGPLSTVFTIAKPDIIGVEVDIPEFTKPENLINEENPVEIVCSFTCIVCSGASLQWTYVGGPLPDGVAIITSPVGRTLTLEITDGSPDQSGTYVCSAVMGDGTVAHSVEVDVTILVTASVWIPQRSKKVPPGESAIFRCQTSRAATFGWNFKTVDGALHPSATFKTISETESQLNVSNVTHNVNTGKYFCAAQFPTGESLKADADLSEQAPLSVAFKVPPSTEPLEESSLTVPGGMEAVVECSLTCGARCPSARVKWLYSDRTEVSTSSMDDVWQDSPVTERLSKLRIKSPSETNVGEYICRASSTGEESTFTSLTIILQA